MPNKKRDAEKHAHKLIDGFEAIFQYCFYNVANNWGPIDENNPLFVLGIIFMAAVEDARNHLSKCGVRRG